MASVNYARIFVFGNFLKISPIVLLDYANSCVMYAYMTNSLTKYTKTLCREYK